MSDRPKAPVKYRAFVDFEYLERGGRYPLVPISMGLVRQEISTGKNSTLYLEFLLTKSERTAVAAHPWLRVNVLPQLSMLEFVTREEAVRRIVDFLNLDQYRVDELWTWYGAHDLVILCGLFGTFPEQHRNLPMFTMDLKQWAVQSKLPPSLQPAQPHEQHHAGADAEWNQLMHEVLLRFTSPLP